MNEVLGIHRFGPSVQPEGRSAERRGCRPLRHMRAHRRSPQIQSSVPRVHGFSVVVPAFQCADRLPTHLRHIEEISHLASEVIWVVTRSADGTHELIHQARKKLGGKLVETPPGLYASWNAGVQQVSSEFTYISTVGEKITVDGLLDMQNLLKQFGADVCFSPPSIYPYSQEQIQRTRHWPVFQSPRLLIPHQNRPLPLALAAKIQILAGLSGLFGSCASCLFRTETLRKKPFPADFLHYGDTAWTYQNLCAIRTIYHPTICSTFHVHDRTTREVRPADLRRCLESLCAAYRRKFPSSPLPRLALLLQEAREALESFRMPTPSQSWWLHPAAWGWRIRREWLEMKIAGLPVSVD